MRKTEREGERESERARERESERAREQESKRAREQESKRAREREGVCYQGADRYVDNNGLPCSPDEITDVCVRTCMYV